MIGIKAKVEGIKNINSTLNGLKKLDNKSLEVTNKVASNTKKTMSSYASSEYEIGAKDVQEATKVMRASKGKSNAQLVVRGSRFSMIRFKVRESKSSPIKVGVKRGQMKPLQRAYVGTARQGLKHVFQRVYSSRYPIQVVNSVSIPQMLGTDKAKKVFETEVIIEFDKKMNEILRGL